jgi:YebC/PmpR family DNA-binding regulatory protein
MAGHSKWSNIKHRKARADAQKGKIFTKISKELMVASKEGGADPECNSRLKLAVQKAKEANMPNDNINRAIQKGVGDLEGVVYEEIIYEGYGPAGVAVLLRILTDNRNRTAGEIRYIFSKNGGNLGETGCVAWMFENKGILEFDMKSKDEEELMLTLIEAGAEDYSIDEDIVEVTVEPENYASVKEALENQEIKFSVAEMTMLPQNTVVIDEKEVATQIIALMEALEDHDDVQAVYSNYDIPEEIMD